MFYISTCTKQYIEVPEALYSKLNKINLFLYESNKDINDYLADLFISEEFCDNVFHRSLDNSDWEKIYYSLKSEKGKKNFKNNGILFEHLSNQLLSENFKLKNLINFSSIDFEDPEKGTDIIFYDNEFKLQFYEVKSRSTKHNLGSQKDLVKLIKKAINSTFCKRLKNVSKLVDAKKNLPNNNETLKAYKLLNKMLKNEKEMVDFVAEDNINFNICIIGEKLKIEIDDFKEEIIEIFNSTKYCTDRCDYKDDKFRICKKGIIDKIIILNIVNIQFVGNLSLNEIYSKIIKKIEKMGVLDE